MKVTLGSTSTCSTAGNSPSASSSAPSAPYIVGRVGRDLAAGSQVQLKQTESKEPGGRHILSAGLPWGTFQGVADENYWLLVEDDHGARLIPAPFVTLKATGPQDIEYDMSEVENRIERRRQTFREEDKRARKRRYVKGRVAQLPWEIEPQAGDSDSDLVVAGAIKALRKGDDEWDARDEEANIFADDEVSVQEWSDNDAPGAPEEDDEMDHKEFATAEQAVDALDEYGHEIKRLLKTELDDAPTAPKSERSSPPCPGPRPKNVDKTRAASPHACASEKGNESQQGPARKKTASSRAATRGPNSRNGNARNGAPSEHPYAVRGVTNAASRPTERNRMVSPPASSCASQHNHSRSPVPPPVAAAKQPKKRLKALEKRGAAATAGADAGASSATGATSEDQQQQLQRQQQQQDALTNLRDLAKDESVGATKTGGNIRNSPESVVPVENQKMVFDREDILNRINSVLDGSETCTLQAVMAEFNLTQNGSAFYVAVATELKAVAKLKRGGILVRRHLRRAVD